MAEFAKFRAQMFNPEVLPRVNPAYGDIIPEAAQSFRVANPEVLPARAPAGAGYATAGSTLEREAALVGDRAAGRLGFRGLAGSIGRGLGVLLSAPVQVPATIIGGTGVAANAEAQRLGLGEGGDYGSFSDASLNRSRLNSPTGVVDVRNTAAEKLTPGWRLPLEQVATPAQSFRVVPEAAAAPATAPVSATAPVEVVAAPEPVRGTGALRISGQNAPLGPERIADTRLGMRGYTVPNPDRGGIPNLPTGEFTVPTGDFSGRGSFSGRGDRGTLNVMESPEQALAARNQERLARGEKAIDAAGREIDPTIEAGKVAAVKRVEAETAALNAEAEAAPLKILAELNKTPDAPKVGLTEVQDPTNPLKMRYLLTEDGVPSPTAIDPKDPVQARALRAFTRARMAGGENARVPFDDFLRYARQQEGQ